MLMILLVMMTLMVVIIMMLIMDENNFVTREALTKELVIKNERKWIQVKFYIKEQTQSRKVLSQKAILKLDKT